MKKNIMKILQIITDGGKYLITSMVFLLISCDSSKPILTNGKQELSYSLHDNEIKIRSSVFGPDYFIHIDSEKPIILQPDSFKYVFSADVSVERIEHINYGFIKYKKDDKWYKVYVAFRKCRRKSLSDDSIMLKIIPSDFILCQGKRVITDTIYINLRKKSN